MCFHNTMVEQAQDKHSHSEREKETVTGIQQVQNSTWQRTIDLKAPEQFSLAHVLPSRPTEWSSRLLDLPAGGLALMALGGPAPRALLDAAHTAPL